MHRMKLQWMKTKYERLKAHPYLPVMVFGIIIAAFYLCFTRLMPKTDDGNFLGMALEEGFSYKAFLSYRYQELSGRTIIEFLTMFFVRRNLVFWQVMCAAIYTYLAYFSCRLCRCFSKTAARDGSFIFCCCSMFLMIVSCINSASFWFSASFTYLLPFFGVVCALEATVFFCLEGKCTLRQLISSIPATVLAVSQEQSLAAFLFLDIVLIVICIFRKRFRWWFPVQLAIGAFLSYYLLHAPGVRNRMAFEADGFARFAHMSVWEKLFCAGSVGFANTVYLSVILYTLFAGLLCAVLCAVLKEHKKKITVSFIIYISVVVLCGLSALIMEKSLPHQIVRSSFLGAKYSPAHLILFGGGMLALCLLLLWLVLLFKADRRLGTAVGLLALSAAGCAAAMGFSSSIFASGQRVYFISNMFVSMACAVLFSRLQQGKLRSALFTATQVYTVIFALLECAAFTFIEHPLMG